MGQGHPKPRIRDFLRCMKVWTYFIFFSVLIFLAYSKIQVSPPLFMFVPLLLAAPS